MTTDAAPTDVRMRRAAVVTTVVAIAPLSVVGVVLTAASWWEGATLAAGYLLTLGVLREWSLDGYPRQAVFALMITAAAWVVGALSAASPISFVPVALVGAMLLSRTRRRALWILAFALGVAGVGAAAFVLHPFTWERAAAYLLMPFLGSLFVAGVILLGEQAWLFVRRLERAKEAAAALALERERVRFAGDLHDIQGQSLHVIKLKAALAGRLLEAEPERAAAELGEIRRLADETIAETRALAYARRELHLAAEVENAKRLGEAAGIAVVTQTDDLTGVAHPLLAQVLREATTNLLRHADPTTVSIRASRHEVEIANDGVADDADTPLRGLARLRERVEAAGGLLRIDRPEGRFVVVARIEPAAAGHGGGRAA